MLLGDRLRAIREAKKLSQGDIEKRSGLLRAYISRVENGHTVPSVETLQKWASALQVPVYQLFYEGAKPPKLLKLPRQKTLDETGRGRSKKEIQFLQEFRRIIGRLKESDRRLLLDMARRMAGR